MQAALRVSGPGDTPAFLVDGRARPFPAAGLYESVCWILEAFPAGFAAFRENLAPRALALRPELLNTAGIDTAAPGPLLFFTARDPRRFFLYGLSLRTGPGDILKGVLEGVAYTWAALLLQEAGGRELRGEGWDFRVDPFCRFLADSSGMQVAASGSVYDPSGSASLFREARSRHARLAREMGGCFSVLADIEKNIT
ncbi:MAG: hypothetical protein ACOC8N_06940 [Spirochaetota bacterium]